MSFRRAQSTPTIPILFALIVILALAYTITRKLVFKAPPSKAQIPKHVVLKSILKKKHVKQTAKQHLKQQVRIEEQTVEVKHEENEIKPTEGPKVEVNPEMKEQIIMSKTKSKKLKRAIVGPESCDEDLLRLSKLAKGGKMKTKPTFGAREFKVLKEIKVETKKVETAGEPAKDIVEEKEPVKQEELVKTDVEASTELNTKKSTHNPVESKEVDLIKERHDTETAILRAEKEALNNTIKLLMQSLSSLQKAAKSDAAAIKSMNHQIKTLQNALGESGKRNDLLEAQIKQAKMEDWSYSDVLDEYLGTEDGSDDTAVVTSNKTFVKTEISIPVRSNSMEETFSDSLRVQEVNDISVAAS